MLYERILENGACTFTDTSRLARKEWLELRKTGIGGSDAGAVMGLSEYATPLSVYLEKKGLVSAFEGNAATEWGNILEEPIRGKAREELGVTVETVPGMFTSVERGFMNANLDGLVFVDGEKEIAGRVVSGLGGHEIKTSRSGKGFTKDEIPDPYFCQVQHYMAVTGLQFFILTVYIFDRYEGRHYVIPRNEAFIESLVREESDFWNENVLKNDPPAPTGNPKEDDLVKQLPTAATIRLDDECEIMFHNLDFLKRQIKELEKEKAELGERIRLAMFKASGGSSAEKTTAVCGGWKIICNTEKRTIVDRDALKKAGLYNEFAKTTSYKVMRISTNK